MKCEKHEKQLTGINLKSIADSQCEDCFVENLIKSAQPQEECKHESGKNGKCDWCDYNPAPRDTKEECKCENHCSCHHPAGCECHNECFWDKCLCSCHTPSKPSVWEDRFEQLIFDTKGWVGQSNYIFDRKILGAFILKERQEAISEYKSSLKSWAEETIKASKRFPMVGREVQEGYEKALDDLLEFLKR